VGLRARRLPRRSPPRRALAAAEREGQLRRSHEFELDRAAAVRREHELELENELRRETEASMRSELSALREELAALAALRADVASVASLREDLAQMAELRSDMSRLRAELSEQLNGEMLVERIMLRTQAIRMPAAPAAVDAGARTVEASLIWDGDQPPRELTGGWPAVRLDELRETRQAERVRVDDLPAPAGSPLAAPLWTPAVPASAAPTPVPPAAPEPVRSAPPPPPAQFPPPTPLEWLADRSLVEPADLVAPGGSRHAAEESEPERSGARPPVPPRRRRTDEPVDDRAAEHAVTGDEPVGRPSPQPGEEPEPAGHQRLTEILAESGAQPPSGGRRRRRYRDDEEQDDVLARVLGRG
jgi:hypothetical protein